MVYSQQKNDVYIRLVHVNWTTNEVFTTIRGRIYTSLVGLWNTLWLFNHKTYQVQDVYIRPVWILKNTFGIQVVKKPFRHCSGMQHMDLAAKVTLCF